MKSILVTIIFIIVNSISNALQAADYSTLYGSQTLQKAQETYTGNLREIWKEDLLGRLSPQEQQTAKDIRLEIPLVGVHRHPFDYYAQLALRRVTIPILSVKFFDDISIAAAWLDQRGCELLAVSDYVGMIRYQDPAQLPDGRFPPPLKALGVPQDVLDNDYVNDVSGKTLKSTIYFLLAHELGHVLNRHRSYNEITAAEAQQQEIEADAFALDVMRRISVPPLGMSVFFTVASRFELAPGDFKTMGDFEDYLKSQSTHPLTSSRLNAIAHYLRNNLDDFTAGQDNPVLWRPRILATANDIEAIGNILDDRQIRELQRQRSLLVTPNRLRSMCN